MLQKELAFDYWLKDIFGVHTKRKITLYFFFVISTYPIDNFIKKKCNFYYLIIQL